MKSTILHIRILWDSQELNISGNEYKIDPYPCEWLIQQEPICQVKKPWVLRKSQFPSETKEVDL